MAPSFDIEPVENLDTGLAFEPQDGEIWRYLSSPDPSQRWVMFEYNYETPDGRTFQCYAVDIKQARRFRDAWLRKAL